MSKSLVKFINIKNYEVNLDRPCKILIEYLVDNGVHVSCNDWIALYPHGVEVCRPDSLDLMVAYEFVLKDPMKKDDRRCKAELSLKGAKNLKYGQKYQFVYISKNSDTYGISETFEFYPPAKKDNVVKSELGRESEDTSKENLEENSIVDKKCKTNQHARQPLVKVEPSERESEEKTWSADQTQREAMKFINKFNKNKQFFEKKQMEISLNGNFCAGPCPSSATTSCSNCHRVAGLLRIQEKLYTQIKLMAEINNDLHHQVAHLQRQLELTQAARQKLYVTLIRERQAKLFFQAAAEYECQIVVVEPFVPSVVMPPRRNPPASGRRRAEEKTTDGYSVLKLKAIIGNQEVKIRSLTKEITQMKRENADTFGGCKRHNTM